ncbi:hypothetical protein PIB30_080467 [Stylosanthes scabra]|uniref:RRM domain-containing protein n=1 Tax=Stylosanthes scabra TaxID=79078 RepID=A0ABU6QTX4_9FABA|nr:hypothetical protein [Stylosanthes scabra]
MRESGVERENKRDGEGNSNGQWRVVTRRKPNSHWWQGRNPTHHHSWRQTDQRKSSQEMRDERGKWIEDETFSIFVDNLPKDSTKGWLWTAFGRTGKIVDVYLSEKVQKSNPLKFAFIRYRSRVEARRTIEHLNGWIVWGCELKLSESRYSRSGKDLLKSSHTKEVRSQEAMNANPVTDPQSFKPGTTKTYSKALKGTLREEEAREGIGNNGLQTLGNSKIYLAEHTDSREKLKRSLVGETLESYNVADLTKSLMNEWPSLKAVKMMGLMKALLVFDTSENMEAALESNRLMEHFLEVRVWSEGDTNRTRNVCTNRTRNVWLEVTGLPIHGWSQENMKAIGNVWAKVLQVGNGEGHFSSFRVLVVTNTGPAIRDMATIVIENTEFLIFVKEEGCTCNGCDGSRKAVSGPPPETSREAEVERSKDEGSKVGESQQSPVVRDEGSSLWASKVGHTDLHSPNSPTRTKSLEDDRRTEQVIREWNESIYQIPGGLVGPIDDTTERSKEDMVVGPDKGKGIQQSGDSMQMSLSAPPGFENSLPPKKVLSTIENSYEPERDKRRKTRSKSSSGKRTSLRLRDRIKEKARKQKETSRKKQATIVEIREEEELGLWQSADEEIEDTEEEIEDTWWVGAKTGICEEYEDRAKKYLRSTAKEKSEVGDKRKEKGKRRKGELRKEVGVSESLDK